MPQPSFDLAEPLYLSFNNYSFRTESDRRETILRAHLTTVLAILCLFQFTGCESGPSLPPTVPAEGVVTLDGTPVADATIVFIADVGTYNATGITGQDGKFAMKAFDEKSGVVAGSYKVEINKTVIETAGGNEGESNVSIKYGLPKKYATFSTSGLTMTIGESGDKAIKFDLKSK